MPINVVIVEDDSGVRAALADYLRQDPECRCAGEFVDGEEALRQIPDMQPDVILMDINLPGISGVECVRGLSPLLPQTQILMLTVYQDMDTIHRALAAGAHGYLVKPVRQKQLLEAIRDVRDGGVPMSSSIARKVLQFFRGTPAAPSDSELTPRELEVLDFLAKGLVYKEIGQKMAVTQSTVKRHVEHIYQKMHVRSRTEAVVQYLQRGRG